MSLLCRTRARPLGFLRCMSTGVDSFSVDHNTFTLPGQEVFAGTAVLPSFVEDLKKRGITRPLVVSDKGIEKVGIVDTFVSELSAAGVEAVCFTDTHANPSTDDVVSIAEAYLAAGADGCIGLGGGGPLDASKAAVAILARAKVDSDFDVARDTGSFVTKDVRQYLGSASDEFLRAIPFLSAVPTTAGTGSDGGKSAVITDLNGMKVVFGHPSLLPSSVALLPHFTAKMPPALTAATGVDALIHAAEAWFVPQWAVERDGMSAADAAECEDFAIRGIRLIVDNLPLACKNGEDLQARLNMQVAALYGAKAFRKGDLGGIHATAHAVGAKYHLHHGACVMKMAVPVFSFNESRFTEEETAKSNVVRDIFVKGGYKGDSLSSALGTFLRQFDVPLGLGDLNLSNDDVNALSTLAAADGCQTNAVPVSDKDYLSIFETARNMN